MGLVILTTGGVLFTEMITLSVWVAPPLSVTVSLTTNFLGLPEDSVNTMLPGLATLLEAGLPPPKFQLYATMLPPGLGSYESLPLKLTVNGELPKITLEVGLATGG